MAALEGASEYLNNLLLARGFLQNGKPIDFTLSEHGAADRATTAAKVVNLIHDLVLRHDREAEQHEAIIATIRDLRAGESQRSLDLQRAYDKNTQMKSKVTTAEAAERSLRSDIRRMDTQIKELKEQALKMKSMLDQVRAKCVGDVKRRDSEIERLKDHIVGLQRGRKECVSTKQEAQTVVSGGKGQRTNNLGKLEQGLEKESSDLLAALVNETTVENVSLRRMISDAITTLKNLTGLDLDSPLIEEDGIGIPGQYRKSRRRSAEAAQSDALVSCEQLAEKLTTNLEYCKTLLKDPSFVPIEEVQVREEEIAKLRMGWEKMADRWKEAVTMMSQWKQRMLQEGRSAEIGDWSDLSFGRSIAVFPDGQPVMGKVDDPSSTFEPSQMEAELGVNTRSEDCTDSSYNNESDLELLLEPAPKRIASSPAKRGVRLPRPARPLTETSGNGSHRSKAQHVLRSPVCRFGLDDSVGTENDTFHHKLRPQKVKVLSVTEKLAAVEAEAAAVRSKSQESQNYPLKRKISSRNAGQHKTSRRRSTLSPEELAAMIGAH